MSQAKKPLKAKITEQPIVTDDITHKLPTKPTEDITRETLKQALLARVKELMAKRKGFSKAFLEALDGTPYDIWKETFDEELEKQRAAKRQELMKKHPTATFTLLDRQTFSKATGDIKKEDHHQ